VHIGERPRNLPGPLASPGRAATVPRPVGAVTAHRLGQPGGLSRHLSPKRASVVYLSLADRRSRQPAMRSVRDCPVRQREGRRRVRVNRGPPHARTAAADVSRSRQRRLRSEGRAVPHRRGLAARCGARWALPTPRVGGPGSPARVTGRGRGLTKVLERLRRRCGGFGE